MQVRAHYVKKRCSRYVINVFLVAETIPAITKNTNFAISPNARTHGVLETVRNDAAKLHNFEVHGKRKGKKKKE